MPSKFKIYYYTSTIVSLGMTTYAILNIKSIIQSYNEVRAESIETSDNCSPYFIWKFSLFFNLFFFFACFHFLGYLLLRRIQNYNKIIYVRIGPMIDRILVLFLLLTSILFGPFLIAQNILIVLNFKEIINVCPVNKDDPVKNMYIPYILLCFILSTAMTCTCFVIITRRCSRRNLMRRRNILNVGELINII